MTIFNDKQLLAFLSLLIAIVILACAAAIASWHGQQGAAAAIGGAVTGLVGVMQFPRWPQSQGQGQGQGNG